MRETAWAAAWAALKPTHRGTATVRTRPCASHDRPDAGGRKVTSFILIVTVASSVPAPHATERRTIFPTHLACKEEAARIKRLMAKMRPDLSVTTECRERK